MEIEKVRLHLEAFDHELLNSAEQKIIDKCAYMYNKVFLPTTKTIYCVLRSPHVYKDSREHFEIRTHKRIIDIHIYYDLRLSNIDVLEVLANIELPAGILYRIYFD